MNIFQIIANALKGNTIRQRVMAVINAKIAKAEKAYENAVIAIDAEAERKKKEAEDQLVDDLTSFIK